MNRIGQIAVLIAGIACIGWLFLLVLKRSDDPKRLLFKWGMTILFLIPFYYIVRNLASVLEDGVNYAAAFFYAILLAVFGLIFAVIWRHSIAGLISKPFESIYTGGGREIDPHPLYSIAQAKRKRGHYSEAVAEIRKQLERFPTDFEGQLMIAEIQAENLNDVSGAELTVRRLCEQAGHAPRNIALALNCVADWQLKFNQDRDAARDALERIIALLPDSEMAALAAQRIGHLADADFLLSTHDRKPLEVKQGVQDLGLQRAREQQFHPPEADPAQQASDYVRHLQEHPMDTEAREKLAVLYADHYGRLELAADQLEQMISHSGHPPRRVAHWLNLLADLQIRHGADYEIVRQTVQRIIDLSPDNAAAQTARNRLDHLKLEMKGQQKGQTVKLGEYEQDLGLKTKPPRSW